jgi:hypothetical protein
MGTGNRLFCTFTTSDDLDSLVEDLISSYTILYNKIFILRLLNNNDYVCTYNIDIHNSSGMVPEGTILVHRKKEYNVLYTINSLNEIIKSLNGGVVNPKFPINWSHYKNSILLTQNDELKQFKTRIFKIIEI